MLTIAVNAPIQSAKLVSSNHPSVNLKTHSKIDAGSYAKTVGPPTILIRIGNSRPEPTQAPSLEGSGHCTTSHLVKGNFATAPLATDGCVCAAKPRKMMQPIPAKPLSTAMGMDAPLLYLQTNQIETDGEYAYGATDPC